MADRITSIRAFGALSFADADGAELKTLLAHRKQAAILLYLALETPRGLHRRDTLLALFWPEITERRARAALNKAVHYLRRAVGADTFLRPRDDVIGIEMRHIRCDVHDLEEAASRGDHEHAGALHSADLLTGFHLDGAPAFMQWLDNRRRALRQVAVESTLESTRVAADRGELQRALAAARRARVMDPLDERAVRATMLLEDRLGDRAAAIRTYEQFAAYVRRELDTDPSPETLAALGAIRNRTVCWGPQIDLAKSGAGR